MKPKIYLLLNLTVIFLIVMFGNGMTLKLGSSSGNGNSAILLFFPLFILFIILVFQWFQLFRNKKSNMKLNIALVILLISHIIVGIYYQTKSYHRYRLTEVFIDQFGYFDKIHIDSITSAFSIHINNQYFNWNTYFLLINVSMLIWFCSTIIMSLFNKKS